MYIWSLFCESCWITDHTYLKWNLEIWWRFNSAKEGRVVESTENDDVANLKVFTTMQR